MQAEMPSFLFTRLRHASPHELVHRGIEQLTWKILAKCPQFFHWLVEIPEISSESILSLCFPQICQDNLSACSSSLHCEEKSAPTEDSGTAETDIRALWESARLQQITRLFYLAQAKAQEGEPASHAFRVAETALFQWLRDNPFLSSPHFLSVMECGLRIPVFFLALKILELSDRQRLQLHQAIFEHGWLIRRRLSLYSSLGNHTVAECVGLVLAGTLFAQSGQGREWFRRGLLLLEQELPHQILKDGGPAEQSLSYHRFVLDLYWFVADFLERNMLHDCSHWKPRLVQGEDFLNALADCQESLPNIGDSDDGRALAPGLAPLRGTPFHVLPSKRVQTFPQSGYTVLRHDSYALLTLDHGPLGMAPLYNHGHADALALTLSVKGKQMLVDSGTYRYNGVPEWRRYFKGTTAHNTVTIDDLDQAVQVTGFIWDKPYSAQLVSCRETEWGMHLEATHNGYTRLPQPVEHRRHLLYAEEGWIIVKDMFSGRGEHAFELNLHLHPEATVMERDGWWQVCRGDAWLALCLLEEENLIHVFGQETPILGWYSPAYGVKQKTSVLQRRKTGSPDAVIFTVAIIFSGVPNRERLQEYASTL
ncbi:alginate lyase family protein [Desulfobulbus sp.]|uniref:alginate lyase family protein n=1 Tax=Desulfobulbus sp. TaxID=895 RepID=UPI0027B91833|nr:alginate lyase family protein [Desulfobulbus sp.]